MPTNTRISCDSPASTHRSNPSAAAAATPPTASRTAPAPLRTAGAAGDAGCPTPLLSSPRPRAAGALDTAEGTAEAAPPPGGTLLVVTLERDTPPFASRHSMLIWVGGPLTPAGLTEATLGGPLGAGTRDQLRSVSI
jgi:hypothetical protein